MKYTVVHSNDPYLLARLATDLQMSGVENNEEWNNTFNPFSDPQYYMPTMWIHLYQFSGFEFHNHGLHTYELTTRNYIKVLTQILEP